MSDSGCVLRYLPAAVEDILAIYDWIAADSPTRAAAFTERVDKRIGALESHPRLGRVPRDERLQKLGYRILIVETFLVFYLIRGTTIEIHRVIHGSRHLDDILR